MLISERRIIARGEIDQVLTSERVSACFGVPVEVGRRSGRWTATLRTPV